MQWLGARGLQPPEHAQAFPRRQQSWTCAAFMARCSMRIKEVLHGGATPGPVES